MGWHSLVDFLHNTCSINVAVEWSEVLVKLSKCVHGFSVKKPATGIIFNNISLLSVKNIVYEFNMRTHLVETKSGLVPTGHLKESCLTLQVG